VNVVMVEPTMISEDFGFFQQGGVPTCLFRLGTVTPEQIARAGDDDLPALHSSRVRPRRRRRPPDRDPRYDRRRRPAPAALLPTGPQRGEGVAVSAANHQR